MGSWANGQPGAAISGLVQDDDPGTDRIEFAGYEADTLNFDWGYGLHCRAPSTNRPGFGGKLAFREGKPKKENNRERLVLTVRG